MNRFFLPFALLFIAAPLGAAAPVFTFLQEIDTGDGDVLPGGIAANGTDLFVAGFAKRRVLKITGAQTLAARISVIYRSSTTDTPAGPIAWDANEGLVTVDFSSPNLLLAAGDTFGDGAVMLLDADTGAVIQRQEPNGNQGKPLRVASAAFYGSKHIVAGYTAGSNYFEFTTDLQNPSYHKGPVPTYSRDLQVGNGNTLYISYNTEDGVMGIHRWQDDAANPGSIAGNVETPSWYNTTVTKSLQTVNGLGRLEHDGGEYLILTDPSGARLIFVDAANPATTFELRNSAITQPRDVVVMSGANGKYLAVTQSNESRVTIFGIDGAVLQR